MSILRRLDALPTNDAVASRPAYTFLALVVGLHFTIGTVLQVANPAFGIIFGELFFFAGLTWLFTRGQNFHPVDFLALRLPPARTLVAAIGAAFAGFFFAGAMNSINRWIVGPEIAKSYDITGLFEVSSALEGAALVFGVAVMAPIGEELVFRGYLQRVLGARYGAMGAVAITAVLFAAIHLNPASVLALFALGVVFALLRLWTGSIWPSIIAHAIQNGTSSALVLTGVAENSPDEMEIGSALVLLAVTAPLLWLALRHLRSLPPAADADPDRPIDPDADHRLHLGRMARPALLLLGAALLSVGLLAVFDGRNALEQIERAAGRMTQPEPLPEPEAPPLPGADQSPNQ